MKYFNFKESCLQYTSLLLSQELCLLEDMSTFLP